MQRNGLDKGQTLLSDFNAFMRTSSHDFLADGARSPMSMRSSFRSVGSDERPAAPRGWPQSPTWLKSASAWSWSRASRRHDLRPWGITGRNDIDGETRMIQIEHDTGDLKREASDLVKAIYNAPKPAAAGPSMAQLREIARLSPAAVVGATNGDLFRFSMGLVTGA